MGVKSSIILWYCPMIAHAPMPTLLPPCVGLTSHPTTAIATFWIFISVLLFAFIFWCFCCGLWALVSLSWCGFILLWRLLQLEFIPPHQQILIRFCSFLLMLVVTAFLWRFEKAWGTFWGLCPLLASVTALCGPYKGPCHLWSL